MASGHSRVKLLLDECIGKPIAATVFDALRWDKTCTFDAMHMMDFMGVGAKDDQWVRRAAAESWFVITADRGKRKDGAPLDLLLPYHGVSAAFMTAALHSQRPQFEKMRAIVSLWPRIKDAANASPAKRYAIRIDGGGFLFKEWPLDARAIQRQQLMIAQIPDTLYE